MPLRFYGFLRLLTISVASTILYLSALLQMFKNRKTVARRHVVGSIVRAPHGNPAMIVRSPHGFYDKLVDNRRPLGLSYGISTAISQGC